MLLGGAGSLATCGLHVARTTTPSSSRLAAGRPAASSTRPLCLPKAKKIASVELSEGLSAGQVQLGQVRLPWLPEQEKLFPVPRLALGAAAALGAGLLAASPAHASDVIAGLQNTFIPGLVGDDPLREGFVQALLLILFSEIGDKTFFIAVLLALQQPKGVVFAGTFGALAVMTGISVGLGQVLHQLDELLPQSSVPWDDLLAVALLLWFGVQTLLSAGSAGETAEEEREEAKEVVSGMGGGAAALGMAASTFALVFAAEWGDKSFLATIALAAASSPTGVVLGAVAGHGVATVIAVLGGSFLGRYLDERAVQYVGGSLFLVFAAATIYDITQGLAP